MAMNILASPTTPATPEKDPFMLPRPNAKELPYMIQILKEMAKVNCEKDYSDWMISLHRHNKLNLVSCALEFFFSSMMLFASCPDSATFRRCPKSFF
jgi:hypothetical protein